MSAFDPKRTYELEAEAPKMGYGNQFISKRAISARFAHIYPSDRYGVGNHGHHKQLNGILKKLHGGGTNQ